uniref:Uncharacterized protein n=1 Tax=Rhizophora mucronata TaxID=61149 RepID=A0A2P2PAJ5_RHIMU
MAPLNTLKTTKNQSAKQTTEKGKTNRDIDCQIQDTIHLSRVTS